MRVSDNYLLRLDFPVSVDDVRYIHLQDKVAVQVQSLGNKLFTGVVSRFTTRVNHDTRTMITEIEVPNPNLELVPGMYAARRLQAGRKSARPGRSHRSGLPWRYQHRLFGQRQP